MWVKGHLKENTGAENTGQSDGGRDVDHGKLTGTKK